MLYESEGFPARRGGLLNYLRELNKKGTYQIVGGAYRLLFYFAKHKHVGSEYAREHGIYLRNLQETCRKYVYLITNS